MTSIPPQLSRALSEILAAVAIRSARSFSFDGHVVALAELREEKGDVTAEEDGAALIRELVPQLYHRCYCRSLRKRLAGPMHPIPDEHFVRELAEANTSRSRVDPGWRVLRLLPGRHCIVQKHEVIRILTANECAGHPHLTPGVIEDAIVDLHWPRDSTTTQSTFYFAIGETVGDHDDDADLLKLYWNVTAGGAPRLVRLLTESLNRYQIPFRLKCLNDPAAYTRADAAVLFLSRRHYQLAAVALSNVHQQLEDALAAAVPLFSKRLAPGLGLAEEPHNGESFGQQRCRILAEGIWNAYRLQLQHPNTRLEEVARWFETHGIRLDAPFLNPGSADRYEWPPHGRDVTSAERLGVRSPQCTFLHTAEALALRLCRDALWAGNRCNWVGGHTFESKGGVRLPVQCACGSDLFGGTSGIALFLGRMYAATGERAFAVTAEGAIRQALSRVDDVRRQGQFGFYTGLTGTAYVLVELAGLLSLPRFTAIASLILEEVAGDVLAGHELSSEPARSSAIPALLHIHQRHPQGFLLELAIAYGKRLLSAAGCGTGQRAWALMELWSVTGEQIFQRAAQWSLASLHQVDGDTDVDAQRSSPEAESAAWMLRPSGIAAVNVRAFELFGDERYLRRAQSLLRSVADRLSSWANDSSGTDFSLAQGLPGHAELLLVAHRTVLDNSLIDAAERIGHRGIELFAGGNRWPCAAPGGAEAPGLMSGLAGIAHFYLRLHNRSSTPPLLTVSTTAAG